MTFQNVLIVHLFAMLSLAACGQEHQSAEENSSTEPADLTVRRDLGVEDIDPDIYFDIDDEHDPFRSFYDAFRQRRESDMNDPSKPGPIESFPAVHLSGCKPWSRLDSVFLFDWPALRATMPDGAAQFEGSVKVRLAFDHPDIKIVQMLLGAGAIVPTHAGGSPGIYIVIEGRGQISVEGDSQMVSPGSTVSLSPYDKRRIAASSEGPLKLLWIRWAPGGDQRYLAAGYYLTGANQHIQPHDAALPDDYNFWGSKSPTSLASIAPVSGSNYDFDDLFEGQIAGLEKARLALGEDRNLYPKVPVFTRDSDIGWLDQETLEKANFFWAKDVKKLGALLTRWSEVMLYKGFFQASRPEGGWDFNISQMVWGPHARYVEHSHSIPEFYYMMSGPVEHWIGDNKYLAQPGDIFLTNSYVPHQSRGIVENLPFRNIGASWAPSGDREVFTRPFFLVEAFPQLPESALLDADATFH